MIGFFQKKGFVIIALSTLLFATSACQNREKVKIKVKGDDVGYFVFENFLEKYNKKSEKMDFHFSGGGSQTAVNSLLDKTAKMVFSLKRLNNEDIARLRSRNIYPVEIALVNIPVIVVANSNLPITDLKLWQVRRIFSGYYKYWWQLGKRRSERRELRTFGAISYCSLDFRNGENFFFKKVINIVDFNIDTRSFNHNLALLEYVKQNPPAIGFVSIPFFSKSDQVKVLYTGDKLEATGYLIMDQRFEKSQVIQDFLYRLRSHLYENRVLLLQKGIKLVES